MKRNIQLLSNRFINDNKPCIAQSREVRLITNKVAAMIRDKGSLIRITQEQCPFCNGDKVTVIAQKDRYGLPMDTQICETCELVFSSKYFFFESLKKTKPNSLKNTFINTITIASSMGPGIKVKTN